MPGWPTLGRECRLVLLLLLICSMPWTCVNQRTEARPQETAAASPQDMNSESSDEVATPQPICLTIDFGDQTQVRFLAIPWHEGMTVLDAMRHVAGHPRAVKFRFRGQQQTAFLEQMGGVANEGGDGRNWMFKVSGKVAQQSFAVTGLQPGDDILWEFR